MPGLCGERLFAFMYRAGFVAKCSRNKDRKATAEAEVVPSASMQARWAQQKGWAL